MQWAFPDKPDTAEPRLHRLEADLQCDMVFLVTADAELQGHVLVGDGPAAVASCREDLPLLGLDGQAVWKYLQRLVVEQRIP